MTREEALALLNKSFGEKIQSKTEFRGETSYTIAAADLRESHTIGRWAVCHNSKYRWLKRPRTKSSSSGIVERRCQIRRRARRSRPTYAAETGGAVSGFRVAAITSGRRPSSRGTADALAPCFG